MTFRRRLGAFGALLITVTVTVAAFGTMPAAANTPTLQYAALGDSYAAGLGGGDPTGPCLQSPYGYPALLDAAKAERVHLQDNATCSGATTADVLTKQISQLRDGTRLITITVGGNDLNVSAIAQACAQSPSPECGAALENARCLLGAISCGRPPLALSLANVYGAVADRSPRARILVTGYPHLLEPTAPFPAELITEVNGLTDVLNASIAGAVAANATQGVNIAYVSEVPAAFAGHGIGSTEPFINVSGQPDAFHPNAAGYRAYAAAIGAHLP